MIKSISCQMHVGDGLLLLMKRKKVRGVIKLTDIQVVDVYSQTEVIPAIQERGSVLGGALVGGALFVGLGAVIGGMSQSGTRTVHERQGKITGSSSCLSLRME